MWPEGSPRRASVNNFGYGGANGHVILEAFNTDRTKHSRVNEYDEADGQIHYNRHATCNGHMSNGHATSKELVHLSDHYWNICSDSPRVFLLTSKDEEVTQTMMSNLAEYIKKKEQSSDRVNYDSIAHTLAARSLFEWRVAVTASNTSQLVNAMADPLNKPACSREVPRLGFVFNGAGAQWFGMGRELFAYPVYAQSMREADRILRDFGAPWSLIGMLAQL